MSLLALERYDLIKGIKTLLDIVSVDWNQPFRVRKKEPI